MFRRDDVRKLRSAAAERGTWVELVAERTHLGGGALFFEVVRMWPDVMNTSQMLNHIQRVNNAPPYPWYGDPVSLELRLGGVS